MAHGMKLRGFERCRTLFLGRIGLPIDLGPLAALGVHPRGGGGSSCAVMRDESDTELRSALRG